MEHLIPEHLVDGLHWSVLLVITAAAMAALIRGADWLVEGASGMAHRFGMPKIIVGATIVSLGTTSPECAVSVMAAWSGNAGLALGNAVGSIIADTALIFGLGAVMVALPADKFVLSRQGWVQFGSAMLLAGLCYGAFAMDAGGFSFTDSSASTNPGNGPMIARWAGALLLGLLAVYLWISIKWARQHSFGEPFQTPDDMAGDAPVAAPHSIDVEPAHSPMFLIGQMIVGLIIVIFSSHVLILAVSELAEQIGVPQTVIAATLVAFGTSLPELMVGIMSLRKGHAELLVGNVIGADILNVLFVIGASAIAKPLPITEPGTALPYIFLQLHIPTMLVVLILFRLFIFRATKKGSFDKWMGWPLLALYVAYVVLQYALTAGKEDVPAITSAF